MEGRIFSPHGIKKARVATIRPFAAGLRPVFEWRVHYRLDGAVPPDGLMPPPAGAPEPVVAVGRGGSWVPPLELQKFSFSHNAWPWSPFPRGEPVAAA